MVDEVQLGFSTGVTHLGSTVQTSYHRFKPVTVSTHTGTHNSVCGRVKTSYTLATHTPISAMLQGSPKTVLLSTLEILVEPLNGNIDRSRVRILGDRV